MGKSLVLSHIKWVVRRLRTALSHIRNNFLIFGLQSFTCNWCSIRRPRRWSHISDLSSAIHRLLPLHTYRQWEAVRLGKVTACPGCVPAGSCFISKYGNLDELDFTNNPALTELVSEGRVKSGEHGEQKSEVW
jgi:hypothetical protein